MKIHLLVKVCIRLMTYLEILALAFLINLGHVIVYGEPFMITIP